MRRGRRTGWGHCAKRIILSADDKQYSCPLIQLYILCVHTEVLQAGRDCRGYGAVPHSKCKEPYFTRVKSFVVTQLT